MENVKMVKIPHQMFQYIESITDPLKKEWTLEALNILIDTFGYPKYHAGNYARGFIEGYVTAKSEDYVSNNIITL